MKEKTLNKQHQTKKKPQQTNKQTKKKLTENENRETTSSLERVETREVDNWWGVRKAAES